jgi:hypothetical protein
MKRFKQTGVGDRTKAYDRLVTALTNSRIATENNALYQTIYGLIKQSSKDTGEIDTAIKTIEAQIPGGGSGGGGGIAPANQTYLTLNPETATLPNSKQLVAGANITLTSIGNTLEISSTGGGSVSTHYDAPLTDGHPDETELIFALGECIIVQVPI